MPAINVKTDSVSYPIIIGTNLNGKLVKELKKIGKCKIFVIYDAQVFALHGKTLNSSFKKAKLNVIELVIPSGEKSKSEKTLGALHSFLLHHEICRSDFILAVGGGVISDLAGYAAATVLRGVRWGVLSTTLLGMVDASIGGKTGINHKTGKNLIGAFWQPSFVVCDMFYLNTLNQREFNAGLGEVAKYAGLAGEPFLLFLENYIFENKLMNKKSLETIISFSAHFKAFLVSSDERDEAERIFLNFGHTFAHAIENSLGYGRLLHGEAVILGLYGAVDLGFNLMQKKVKRYKSTIRYQTLLKNLMLSVPKKKLSADKIYRAMSLDKKRTATDLQFILIEKPGKPYVVSRVKKAYIMKAINNMINVYYYSGGKIA